ncbi:lipopolysaccharide biosynthesis protein [Hydrogenophaga sp.]|uniref:lipopolysaccharide biosynthesis protein n=1 Tax=Hydrogenophaga sp. TaxID=1904254 RepID=UPI0035AF3E2B
MTVLGMLQTLNRYYQTHKTRIYRLSVEGGWVIAGQVASVIGALVLVRVLTEHLDSAQYGQLALGLTVAGFVNQVVMGGIANGIGRYYSIAAEKKELSCYLHATRELLVYATAVVVVIGLVLTASLYWIGYPQWISLAVAALLLAVLNGYNSTLNGIQNAARQRAIVAFNGGLDAWLKILLAIGAMLWLGTSSTAVIIGYICSSLVITFTQIIFLRRAIPKQHHTRFNCQQWMSQIWAYSLPFTTWGAFTWLQQISDRWALKIFASTSDVGQYAVLFQLGFTPTTLITGMSISLLAPILYQRSGNATDESRNAYVHRIGWRIAKFSFIVTLLVFVITYTMHDWLFGMLVAPKYRENSHLLPWVVLAGGIFAAGQILALKLMSEMRPAAMTTPKIATALLGALLNAIGAALGGLHGVVWAMVCFSSIYFIWMAILANRIDSKATEI